MIDPARLLDDLRPLVRALEEDLRERSTAVAEVGDALRKEHAAATAADRTADPYEVWRDDTLTQVAVAWVLGCVFVRFLEDTGLVPEPRLAGPGDRLHRARDHHILYFRQHPMDTDREYLHAVFREVAALPAAAGLFDERHNPLWQVGLSGDGATRLLEFWQRIDPATGALAHDFTDQSWNTRFLGDLYQDLSEAARKKYALLQTPEFVEEFIIDRTLTPAIDEFGYREVSMLDPTCGSGHFLLGGFQRLLRLWTQYEPAVNARELAQRALDQVYGVDLNPFAVAIARFRLLVAALQASDVQRLQDAPAFRINVATGDSLLHGRQFTATSGPTPDLYRNDAVRHVYQAEDAAELARILGRQYHAVVGNPPYITVKDKALNQAYRDRYGSCHRQYSLAVPFMERFFELALCSSGGASSPPEASAKAGFVGMITANSFMKREFGKKLIEQVIPRWDLTHVIDTSGAYIPGHGTPTAILFGRHRPPVADTVRAVMGIRGEPSTPEDPAHGLVWTAIVSQVDHVGSVSEYVSVADMERESFAKHPWSIGGGGAAELKEILNRRGHATLGTLIQEIGRTTHTGEDDVFYMEPAAARTHALQEYAVPLVVGEDVRDWSMEPALCSVFPYDKTTGDPVDALPVSLVSHFWTYRTVLRRRKDYGQTPEERGLRWFDHSMFFRDRFRTPLSIAFAFVATHNHFVLDRGGKVFKQSAPVIKLPPDATEDDHLALLGLLNSSTACFWMKQVFHNKGSTVDERGARQTTVSFENFYEFTGTGLERFPVEMGASHGIALSLGIALDRCGKTLREGSPREALTQGLKTSEHLRQARACADAIRGTMIALQEELDWECYRLYGLTEEPLTHAAARAASDPLSRTSAGGDCWFSPGAPLDTGPEPFDTPIEKTSATQGDRVMETGPTRGERIFAPFLKHPDPFTPSSRPFLAAYRGAHPFIDRPGEGGGEGAVPADLPPLQLGERAFEIVTARKMAAGELTTAWFERHGSTPITALPSHWPEAYRRLVERRIEVIETNPYVRLIEQPEYKRRWNTEPWEARQDRAVRDWLLDRLEDPRHWPSVELTTCARLADRVRQDADFLQVAELYRGRADYDLTALVTELVESESVPFLPVLRYKDSGLRKRELWERTWELQREEDRCQGSGVGGQGADRNQAVPTPDTRPPTPKPLQIPVPPKYTSADFLNATFWRLRGKLDVPKERFVSYPHCERDADPTPVIAWAGWDHLQQAQALAAYYVAMKETEGWTAERLTPLLAGLLELLPWVQQWHNEVDPGHNLRMGDYFADFVTEEARALGVTTDQIRAWKPPAKRGRRKG
ncbi:BREX-2 system adenine-specific DNA-methyltransferase PglX [Candidatus Binatia bacterium]|nr:BREX-2 system adenine-specific DNA-methyltransferase PglX [Candidatus Binatia bacterium]